MNLESWDWKTRGEKNSRDNLLESNDTHILLILAGDGCYLLEGIHCHSCQEPTGIGNTAAVSEVGEIRGHCYHKPCCLET